MSGKKAKAIRKASKQVVDDMMAEKLKGQVPIAGCPQCEFQYWMLELDLPAPDHTFIENFICGRPECNQKILAHVNIHDTQHQVDVDQGRVEDLCKVCGFEAEDCQCNV